jgi:hypothetical protein
MKTSNDLNINEELEVVAKNLQYPKNIVFDSKGIMYFIDANEIKLINIEGIIEPLVKNEFITDFRPNYCNKSFSLSSVRFYWPISLAVNPIDNSLYVLDEGVIYKIAYNVVSIIAGKPFGCKMNKTIKLNNPIDMAFSNEGDLYVLENDSVNGIKQIRLFKSDGSEEIFFGQNNRHKLSNSNVESTAENVIVFNDPIAIAVHQNRSVYVLDKGKIIYLFVILFIIGRPFS